MKKSGNFILFIIFSGLFLSCRKELSFEGHLTKDAVGNCAPVTIKGIYQEGVLLTDTNYLEVSVNVTHAGNYSITTDTLNGTYFNKNSRFTAGGTQMIKLEAHGTPISAGKFLFKVHYYSLSSCTVLLAVAPPGPTAANFSIECSSGSYTSPHVQGIFVAGYPLNDSSKLIVFVQVSSVGNYTLSTNTVNGFSFKATGTFTSTGGQYVTLPATGTPTHAGITSLSVSGGTSTGCDVSVPVNPRTTDSSKMFYSLRNPNGSFEIYSSNTDGTNEKKLTDFSNNGTLRKQAIQHSFNADSTKLIFIVADDRFGGNLMRMNLDGSGVIAIAPVLGNKIHDPYVFENGQKLLFWIDTVPLLYGGYPAQIFTANMDGTNLVKLTSVAAGNGLPDGSSVFPGINKANNTIIYVRGGAGTNGIYGMNTDGSNKYPIVVNQLQVLFSHPQFSPDGAKILYYGQLQPTGNVHGSEIFMMNTDGSNTTQLTNYSNNWQLQAFSDLPVFSKDGKTIYFDSNESGIYQIYKMNIDGTGKTKITNGALDRTRPLVN